MLYNIVGAIAWISLLGGAGYYLGTYEWVQKHIGHIVIMLIIITLIPIVITYRKENKRPK